MYTRNSALIGALSLGVAGAAHAERKKKRSQGAKTYCVDREYSSRKGPQSTREFVLGEGTKPELVWVTGYEAVMVGKDGSSPMPQDFMCHSNLDVDPMKHRDA